jgi:colanic acid/amylovoran biosynthesis protein
MTRIFIDGAADLQSLGTHASTICTIAILNRFFPKAELTMLSPHPETHHRILAGQDFNLKIVRRGNNPLSQMLILLREYIKTDVTIGMYTDAFVQETFVFYGSTEFAKFIFKLLMATSFGKPVILFPLSIGPFKTNLTRTLARIALDRVGSITAREAATRNYLLQTGISRPEMHLTPDVAFVLEPASDERIREIFLAEGIEMNGSPLIGMNVSQLLNYKSRLLDVRADYVELMAHVAEYLTDRLNATVILIPHEIHSRELRETVGQAKIIGGDDIVAVNQVAEKVKNRKRIVPLTKEYDARDLKGIISRCDLFIGARMHSVIAAISMCVPSIAIMYSHKTLGTMELVGLQRYVCDFRTMTFEELTSKIDDIWFSKNRIMKEMSPKVEALKRSVWSNGKTARTLMDARIIRSHLH